MLHAGEREKRRVTETFRWWSREGHRRNARTHTQTHVNTLLETHEEAHARYLARRADSPQVSNCLLTCQMMTEGSDWYSFLYHHHLLLIEVSTGSSSNTDGSYIFLLQMHIQFDILFSESVEKRFQSDDSRWNDSFTIHAQLHTRDSLPRTTPQWLCARFQWIKRGSNPDRWITSANTERYGQRTRQLFSIFLSCLQKPCNVVLNIRQVIWMLSDLAYCVHRVSKRFWTRNEKRKGNQQLFAPPLMKTTISRSWLAYRCCFKEEEENKLQSTSLFHCSLHALREGDSSQQSHLFLFLFSDAFHSAMDSNIHWWQSQWTARNNWCSHAHRFKPN